MRFRLILFFVLITAFFKAQNKIGIIAGGGYNTQVMHTNKIAPVSYSYHNMLSPVVGVIYRDSIYRWLYLKTGTYYVQRGVKFDYLLSTPIYTLHSLSKFTGHYASVPLRLYAHIKGFFIGAGVESSFLIRAHHQVTIEEKQPAFGYDAKNVLDEWYGEKWYQAVDAGYNFNIGYKWKQFEIEGSLFHGLIKPPKFDYFSHQHFEFKYAYQETFMLTFNYFPNLKRKTKK